MSAVELWEAVHKIVKKEKGVYEVEILSGVSNHDLTL